MKNIFIRDDSRILSTIENQEKTDMYPSVFFEKRNLFTNKRS